MQYATSYWQRDFSLGEAVFSNKPLRMRLHVGTERYSGMQEIVPVIDAPGLRTSAHARPYTLFPRGLTRRLSWLGTLIRRVTTANWQRLTDEDLGDCHAWYYHQDRMLILWDCLVYERATDPRADHTLGAVWQGFEQVLLASFPDTGWIATPSWEPVYATQDWQAFLQRQGYQRFNQQAFMKEALTPKSRHTR